MLLSGRRFLIVKRQEAILYDYTMSVCPADWRLVGLIVLVGDTVTGMGVLVPEFPFVSQPGVSCISSGNTP